MHNNKINPLLLVMTFSLWAPGALAAETEKWNGTVLGFEKPQTGLLGDMLGIRPILEDNGFNYNLGLPE